MTELESIITDRTGMWVRQLKQIFPQYKLHFPEPIVISVREILHDILLLHLSDHPDEAIEDIKSALVQLGIPEKDRDSIVIRFTCWPRRTRIRDLEAGIHINHFVSLEGLIRKATDPHPYPLHTAYRCNHCGKVTIDPVDMACSSCERKLPRDNRVDSRCTFINHQRIELQEVHEDLKGREQPRPIPVDLFRDLTDRFQPGDRVIINGILRTTEKKGRFSYCLETSSIEPVEIEYEDLDITDEDQKAIIALSKGPDLASKMIASIDPTIYGHDIVKEAITLQLFGGVTKENPDGITAPRQHPYPPLR